MGKMRFKLIRSFTLIELMVVVAIIAVLAGLVLGGAGAVRSRAARGQAKAEIAAIEAGLARYQMDFGGYPVPTNNIATNQGIYARNPSSYVSPGQALFTNLWGTNKFNASPGERKAYISVRPSMVNTSSTSTNLPDYFIDPWGNAYGYFWNGSGSLFGGAVPDVWSTGGQNGSGSQTNEKKWITSWN